MENNNQHIEIFDLITKLLTGEAHEEEIWQVNDWKQADTVNAQLYEEYIRLWNRIGKVRPIEINEINRKTG